MKSLDLAAEAVTRAVGGSTENEGYGVYSREQDESRVVLRTRTCAMWELAKDRLVGEGLAEDTFCGAHQVFYQELAHQIDQRMVFRFTRALARGDDCCEWVFEIL